MPRRHRHFPPAYFPQDYIYKHTRSIFHIFVLRPQQPSPLKLLIIQMFCLDPKKTGRVWGRGASVAVVCDLSAYSESHHIMETMAARRGDHSDQFSLRPHRYPAAASARSAYASSLTPQAGDYDVCSSSLELLRQLQVYIALLPVLAPCRAAGGS